MFSWMKALGAGAFCLLMTSPALAEVEFYFGIPAGNVKLDETSGSETYNNTSAFFGHFGLGLGTRWKIYFGDFGVGAVADYAWVGDNYERDASNPAISTVSYRTDSTRLLVGATASWNFATWFRLMGEYYPTTSRSINYADNKSENPWNKGDQQAGSGFGLGCQFKFGKFTLGIMYRNLTEKVADSATRQFSTLMATEVLETFGLEF